jgi:4-amino-4-deoxy-L-arabinose transferase-like glycosyltransferase
VIFSSSQTAQVKNGGQMAFLAFAAAQKIQLKIVKMDPRLYYFLHVFSIILPKGFTCGIAENAQKHKKKFIAIVMGILALIVFVGVFGLITKLHNNNFGQGRVILKILAWLFVSGLGGMAYKKSKLFIQVDLVPLVGIAVFMVYFRPF